MLICPNCGEENPSRFRLCGYCGTPLAAVAAPEESRKTTTILFCDLKGSTSLAEGLDSEAFREVLNLYFATMRKAIEAHGATVEKYIGDAVMAVFGLPRAHEDDALRAVKAALGMQVALAEVNRELEQRWGVRLANRIGINTGEVVAGDVVTGQRLVTGDAVNVAARFEQAAGENEVLMGESTYRLVRTAVRVETVEPLVLKGKSEPMPAYRVLGLTSVEAFARRMDSPMIGRAMELSLLLERFQRAADREGVELTTVVGDAGVGKSRLILELIRSIGDQAMVGRGRCLSYGEGITFWPIVEIVRDVTGILPEGDPEEARAGLETLTEGAPEGVAERVASVMGLSAATYPLEEIFWALRLLFCWLARERPLVLVVDDIHWAAVTFLDFLEHLAGTPADTGILIVCSSRPELLDERPEWAHGLPNTLRVRLEPLSEDESADIIGNMLGGSSLPPELDRRITHAAHGIPLFVEQMVSMLMDDGVLVPAPDGSWEFLGDPHSFEVPPTIFALLGARLDRLSPEERMILQRGSVMGQVFYAEGLVALTPEASQDRIDELLTVLAQKQLVSASEPDALENVNAFQFGHVLIRDAAYGGLLKRDRISLHEHFARWFELAAGSLTEFEEVVGYHFEQSWHYRSELGPLDEEGVGVGHRAAQLLGASGRRAIARGDMPAAANLLGRAASLVPPADPLRLAILAELGEALRDLGEFDRAIEVLDEAIERAADAGERGVQMHARVGRKLVHLAAGDDTRMEDVFQEIRAAVPVFEELGDDSGLARAWRLIGSLQATAGHYGVAERAVLRAMKDARRAGDRRQQARSFPLYVACAVYGPTAVDEGIARCEQLLGEAVGELRGEALIKLGLSQLVAMRGEFDRARDLYRQSRAILEDIGETVLAASTSVDSARVEILAEDPEAAEQQLRGDFEVLETLGEKYYLGTVAALLGHVLYLRGHLDEAERFSAVAEQADQGDVETQVLWRRARAKVFARQSRFTDATALMEQILTRVRDIDSPVLHGNTQMDLAEMLVLEGRVDEGIAAVGRALELYERKGSVVAAGRARGTLERLTGSQPRGSGLSASPGSARSTAPSAPPGH